MKEDNQGKNTKAVLSREKSAKGMLCEQVKTLELAVKTSTKRAERYSCIITGHWEKKTCTGEKWVLGTVFEEKEYDRSIFSEEENCFLEEDINTMEARRGLIIINL